MAQFSESGGVIRVLDSKDFPRLVIGADGTVLVRDSTGENAATLNGGGGSSVLTTKGDLLAYGTGNARLAVGAQGYFLVSDSTQTLGLGWGRPLDVVDCKKEFGVAADDSTDDTTAFQDAIDAAGSVGGICLHPGGTIKITDTITWTYGAILRGGYGAHSVAERIPEISWYGAAGGTMITTDTQSANRDYKTFTGLSLRKGASATNAPGNLLVFTDRCDFGTFIQNCAFAGGSSDFVVFQSGGLNVYMDWWRADGMPSGFAAIKWTQTAFDQLTLSRFTIDNGGTGGGGGAFHMDGTSGGTGSYMKLGVSEAKLEANATIASGKALFQFDINQSISQKVQLAAKFDNVIQTNAGGLSNTTSILVNPSRDFVDVNLSNCVGLSVSGIPAYSGSLSGTTLRRPLTIIAPHRPSLGISPSSERSSIELFGDVNALEYYMGGKKVVETIYASTTDTLWNTSPLTVQAGTWFFDPANVSSAWRTVLECTGAGTLGTLTGITGSGNSGQAQLTVSDATLIKIGQHIKVDSEAKTVVEVDYANNIVSCSSNLSTTHTNGPVVWNAPTFKTRYIFDALGAIGTPTYGSTTTPNAAAGEWQTITVTNTNAITMAAPSNPPASTNTQALTIEVLNSSGGAMGTITWNAAYVFNGLSWTNPASTKRRYARFEWNGSNWIATAVAGADY